MPPRKVSWVLILLLLTAGGLTQGLAAEPGPFVTTSGTQFFLDGEPFYVAGTNNHYIHYAPRVEVNRVLADAAKMGLNVIRVWGFIDIGCPNDSVPTIWGSYGPQAYDLETRGVYFQYWNAETGRPAYNDGPDGLERLDYLLAKAGEQDLKLIITLTNNWPHLGGVQQYMTWLFLNEKYLFYTDEKAKQVYKDWVAHLLNRVNTVTGIPYRDDPTIFAWQLMNEPHNDHAAPWIFTEWAAEMSAFIKELDPNHMVSIGDEGFFNWEEGVGKFYNGSSGTDFDALLNLPTVDFGTYHLYPDWWETTPDWGKQWIAEHIEAGKKANKPVLLEEFGWRDDRTKKEVYDLWFSTLYEQDGAGWLFWRLVGPAENGVYPHDSDGFDIRYPGELAFFIADWARKFVNRNKEEERTKDQVLSAADVEFRQLSPADSAQDAGLKPTFTWEPVEGVISYALIIANDPELSDPVVQTTTEETSYSLETALAYGQTYYWKVAAVTEEGTIEALNAGISFRTGEIPKENMIEDFEGYGGSDRALRSFFKRNEEGNIVEISLDSGEKKDGKYGMKFQYLLGDPGWAGVINRDLRNTNWTGAEGIQFWLVPDGSHLSLSIQFQEAGGEYWEAGYWINGAVDPVLVQIPFSRFIVPPWAEVYNNKIDLHSITAFAIYVGKLEDNYEEESGVLFFDSFSLMGEVERKSPFRALLDLF